MRFVPVQGRRSVFFFFFLGRCSDERNHWAERNHKKSSLTFCTTLQLQSIAPLWFFIFYFYFLSFSVSAQMQKCWGLRPVESCIITRLQPDDNLSSLIDLSIISLINRSVIYNIKCSNVLRPGRHLQMSACWSEINRPKGDSFAVLDL